VIKLFARMIGAARLDPETYEQVEADSSSGTGAVITAVVASLAAAIAIGRDVPGIAAATFAFLVTWLVWVGLTYFIGTRLLPENTTRSDLGEVLRTTGFSASPGVLRILAVVPYIGLPVFIGVTIWMLLAFVVAVRQALDYTSYSRAFAVCFLGWLIHALVFFGLVSVAI
jgi:cobalamin synthase